MHMIVFSVIYGLFDGLYTTTLNFILITCVNPAETPTAIDWLMHITSFFEASGPPIAGMSLDCDHKQSTFSLRGKNTRACARKSTRPRVFDDLFV